MKIDRAAWKSFVKGQAAGEHEQVALLNFLRPCVLHEVFIYKTSVQNIAVDLDIYGSRPTFVANQDPRRGRSKALFQVRSDWGPECCLSDMLRCLFQAARRYVRYLRDSRPSTVASLTDQDLLSSPELSGMNWLKGAHKQAVSDVKAAQLILVGPATPDA